MMVLSGLLISSSVLASGTSCRNTLTVTLLASVDTLGAAEVGATLLVSVLVAGELLLTGAVVVSAAFGALVLLGALVVLDAGSAAAWLVMASSSGDLLWGSLGEPLAGAGVCAGAVAAGA